MSVCRCMCLCHIFQRSNELISVYMYVSVCVCVCSNMNVANKNREYNITNMFVDTKTSSSLLSILYKQQKPIWHQHCHCHRYRHRHQQHRHQYEQRQQQNARQQLIADYNYFKRWLSWQRCQYNCSVSEKKGRAN